MSYQVLARKWRPATFEQLVGQEHVAQALVNALDGDRLHHAYLFSGTRGVGKTTIARIFAKALNCEKGISSKPCGKCHSCEEIDQGRSLDLIEIDAASRTGVDDMRELLDNVQYAPTRGRFKVYLIDEIHMLSKNSFNALLKTLEEPPAHIKFLLATTDPQKIPVTVLSRCLQFSLKHMSRGQILHHLEFLAKEEKIEAESAALMLLASAANGSMRDALSLLDQAIAYGAGSLVQSSIEAMLGTVSRDYLSGLCLALLNQDAAALIGATRRVIEQNPDYQRICSELIGILQSLALAKVDSQLTSDGEFSLELIESLSAWSAEEVQLYYQILLHGRQDLLIAPDEASGFEMLMLRLLAFSPAADELETAARVKKKPELSKPALTAPELSTLKLVKPELAKPELARPEFIAPELITPADATLGEASGQQGPVDSAIAMDSTPSIAIATPPIEVPREISNPEIDELNWSALAYQLGLKGLAQEIVVNSVVHSYQNGLLKLIQLTDFHEFVTEQNQQEILEALRGKLGVSLKLDLQAAESLPAKTPQQIKSEQQLADRESAILAIKQQPVVKKLQQALAVELDLDSVVKNSSN